MDDFEKELKAGFLEEASQLIADTEQCFLALESDPGNRSTLEKIFRLAHNLKGSAKAVGFDSLGEFAHHLESYLLRFKDGRATADSSAVNLLLRCNDQLLNTICALKNDFGAKLDNTALLQEMERAAQASEPAVAQAPEPVVAPPEPEAALRFKKGVPKVEQAGQWLADLTTKELAKEPVEKSPVHASATHVEESIRVSLKRVEKLIDFVGEMVILQTVLREQAQGNNTVLLRKTVHQLGKVSKEIQDISMSLRMVPLKQTFQKMQRIVRDTSTALGKKVNLTLLGEETEVDKTVLERLSDPLVHLVRNAVDHGIEGKDERLGRQKAETGELVLQAYHRAGSLVIEVRDDGAGLDPARLTAKAIEKGILKEGTVLSDAEAHQLIFHPGFSTKAVVTDVSGRGVGMDVVKTNIESMQGTVAIETQVGSGTCFKITLPLTLAIIDGMVVRSAKERYVIPLAHVQESTRPDKSDIHHVTGIGEVFCLRGENMPIFQLGSVLGKTGEVKPPWESIAIVVRSQDKSFSLLVDDIIGQHQVVVKQLGLEHRNLRGFSGSTILGDGCPALILEASELLNTYRPQGQRAPAKGAA